MSKTSVDYFKSAESGVQLTEGVIRNPQKYTALGLLGPPETKLYKKRWAILGIFVFYSASNAMQWIQYSIIANIVMKYYDVTDEAVNWTSLIYMVLYIPFIFPASYLLDKLLGVAVGFLFPPMLVKNSEDVTVIGDGLQTMFYIVAAITSVILVLILLFFKAEPPLPPSSAQAVQREAETSENFLFSVKTLLLNKGYLLLLLSYAINVGIFYALSTLLSQIILPYYPGHETDAGRIGLVIVLAGMLGSVLCGVVLDKTHRFKETTLCVYIFSFLGMMLFTFTLDSGHIYVVYLTSASLGFFMTGYLPVGFEFATELTYPEPEGTSAGLLNAATQVLGILFTLLYSHLFTIWGIFWANIGLCVTLGFGCLMTTLIPNDLRRQKAKL
ncbi:feline leukemia virus subgroup C receptor-related protein 1 isoform X3 [Neodiprion virginianus]|uniref:Feline leukemia virus subgroup C receptor-related protein 1 isoform X3 n=1 Tax=Neodiprion lecontei TaxID=441921 RepID=A0ABM3FQQ3_NEOLC|nr:feline leukemia virus subgroup C receptor-related protein 1 isoform X3 [Neodiprion fabricii]XP_046590348.1 feline leukemia virus subgroup C receptor-related protein 1 isoform X3 [Neodiprion lecontei]XP_046622025.1 feline leukemia virus subgroup C receptor-related protein 1 isoform X3 [Neodiprion virginianus]